MKYVIRVALCLGLMSLCMGIEAQTENTKGRKSIKKKLWGGYDSNAIDKNLEIKDAFVTEGEEMLPGVSVDVLVNNNMVDSTTTDSRGGFAFNLKFDFKYVLRFSKKGYVTKLVEIDLQQMPPEAKREGYDLGRFQMGMVKKIEGMDTVEYSLPVARYYYDVRTTLIQLDRVFLKNRKEAIEKQKEQNSKIVAEQKELELEADAEYNRKIRDADIEFEAQDYELAKTYYKEAIKLKSLEEYPRSQLIKIDGLEKDLLGEDQKYNALIEQGDEAFDAKDYSSAKMAYTSAVKMRTTEPYPREKLKKIESLQKAKPVIAEGVKKNSDYDLKNIQIGADKSAFCAELAKKYPQGLTEETYEEGGKKVTKRVIVDGSIGVEFKKVVHNWGGVYYFKNGSPTTNFTWQKEAMQ